MSHDDGVDRLFSYWAAFYHRGMIYAILLLKKTPFLNFRMVLNKAGDGTRTHDILLGKQAFQGVI